MSDKKNTFNSTTKISQESEKEKKNVQCVEEPTERQLSLLGIVGVAQAYLLIVTRRKEPSDKGVTHYAFEDPWKPNSDYQPNGNDQHNSSYGSEEVKNLNSDRDDLPF